MANVSVSTVSRVLNNSKYVSDDLRQRVLKVVEETGYKPNMVARGLVQKKTKLLGVLIPRISNDYFSQLIEGIEIEAQKYGYNLLLTISNNEEKREREYLEIFEERQLDGIIFSVTKFTELHHGFFAKTTVPSVFLGQAIKDQEKYPYITINNENAAYEATKYLLSKNHRKIAILAGPLSDIATGVKRIAGYKKALAEAGIKFNPAWQTNNYHTIENGYRAAEQIMSTQEKPTAIFACSDQQALGAVNYLQEQGYRVPDDISVMGFDDIDLASVFKPRLTTIRQYPKDIGKMAIQLLMDQINDHTVDNIKNIAPYKLVVRESTLAKN